MTEIKRSIQIEAPVQKVFAYASDYLKWQEFFVGVKDVNPITEKTHCSGAKFIYRAQVLGMENEQL